MITAVLNGRHGNPFGVSDGMIDNNAAGAYQTTPIDQADIENKTASANAGNPPA